MWSCTGCANINHYHNRDESRFGVVSEDDDNDDDDGDDGDDDGDEDVDVVKNDIYSVADDR